MTEIRRARRERGPCPGNRLRVRSRWAAAVRDRKARTLMVRALRSRSCRLWVLGDNARARRFYERHGWRENGESRVVEFPPNPLDIGYSLDF